MTDKLIISLLVLITALSIISAFTDISVYEVFPSETAQTKSENPDKEAENYLPAAADSAHRSTSIPRNIVSPIFTTSPETAVSETDASAAENEVTNTEETTAEEAVTAEEAASDITTDEPALTAEETEADTTAEASTAEDTSPETEEVVPEETTKLPESTYCWEITEVLRLINEKRAAAGVNELALDDTLCTCADVRAYESTLQSTHTRPDGRRWLSVYSDYGYDCSTYGECCAYGQSTPSSCVSTWMNDGPHRSILLDSSYTSVGIGIYWVGDGYYWTADFAG